MTMNFDSTRIELTCPKCAHKLKESIGRLKNDPTIPCPQCGAKIVINAQGLRDGLGSAEKSISDFRSRLGKLFK